VIQRTLTRRDLRAANIGERYFDASLETVRPQSYLDDLGTYIKALEEARRYGYGLFIQGADGCGKTYGMAVILKAAMQFGYEALMVSPSEVKQLLAGDLNTALTIGQPNILTEVDFLGIDGLGSEQFLNPDKKRERGSFFFETVLEDLLRSRSKNKLPTLITSKSKPSDLSNIYGNAVVELMVETVNLVTVKTTENLRAQAQKTIRTWFNSHKNAQ
jgi:DNA replication protein DnaC